MTKKKPKSEHKPKGRPSTFTASIQELLRFMYEHGYTDKQVALQVGVNESTVNNWKKKHPDFFKSLKEWKSTADNQVEASLFQRAIGYDTEETKVFCTKDGSIKTHTMKKHYAPDVTAQIFWLKNRQPDKWRDKQEIEHGTGDKSFKFGFDLNDKPEG